ncbi:MAG: Glu-tRNA(Gln) amidotransferase GatDE subunit D, partial [Nanohaloarchaea archaeon]|nr:Glu-tRNA(Gln) amidotransferase GatDE subunit D [Candidatus Nanohaloarchaea archaeon]
MYSKKIKEILENEKIAVGSRIAIKNENKMTEGILLPNAEDSASDIITLKLDNGYNIGIKIT